MSGLTGTASSNILKGPDVDVAIIGAGFSGLYAIHRLHNLDGLSVMAFEATDNVGGTWNINRYPGARCDSEGYMYCYSFDEELLQEWSWTGKYPEQAELLAYLEYVADKHDLRRHIRFNQTVTKATFDEVMKCWIVGTSSGATFTATYLVTGLGHLSIAQYVPDIPGREDFQGKWYHSSRWPREGVDLRGKRVGVIGTGSSGVQMIPIMAQEAAHLTVFQRSPQYSIPARHETATDAFFVDIKSRYAEIWSACRRSAGGFEWQHNGQSALSVSEEERRETYERQWAEGGIKFYLSSYRDLTLDLDANATVSDFIREKIGELIHDPITREALLPYDHPFASRRPIVDTNYFETFNRPNVRLVDLRKTPIDKLSETGIMTSDEDIELDIIVFATGFDAVTGPFFNIDIRGRDGVRLLDAWSQGPRAYLGLMTVGFPNMFMLTGPTSVTGNLPLNAELHGDWVGGCIRSMRQRGARTIEPSSASQDAWMEEVAASSDRSMVPHADSWFNGANIPGKSRGHLFYFGHFGRYRKQVEEIAQQGYRGFVFDGDGEAI